MAEKETILNTRIILKNADFNDWQNSSLVLKAGEIALAKFNVETVDDNGIPTTTPTYLMKVGDGKSIFADLNWFSAPASDVYDWAKRPGLAYEDLPETLRQEIALLQDAIAADGSVNANINQQINSAIEALDFAETEITGEGKFVTLVTQTDGKITVTRAMIEIADVEGLTAALEGKADKSAFDTLNDIVTAPNTGLKDKVSAIESKLNNVSNVMDFVGVLTDEELPEVPEGQEKTITAITTGYNNGDVVIYKNQEYVFIKAEDAETGHFEPFGNASKVGALEANVEDALGRIKTIEDNYVKVETTGEGETAVSKLVNQAGEVIIFDCGGVTE